MSDITTHNGQGVGDDLKNVKSRQKSVSLGLIHKGRSKNSQLEVTKVVI